MDPLKIAEALEAYGPWLLVVFLSMYVLYLHKLFRKDKKEIIQRATKLEQEKSELGKELLRFATHSVQAAATMQSQQKQLLEYLKELKSDLKGR